MVLALAGTPAVRPNARLAGLALTGALLALLVATAFSLDEPSQRTLFYSPEDGFQVEYGRGLVMAFVGCLLLVAALQLSGQATEAPTDSPGWRWPGRRDRPQPDDDELPAPADLTVGPAVPFARPEPQPDRTIPPRHPPHRTPAPAAQDLSGT
ncbi:hypothetical protein GA0070617_0034 [Micromonospora yangpuensis]|uniref:Uncharacterized protein n=1 Tax=Micromonospora yangpuensis TaxID=683228 RepID=A0A1C6TVF0_9ACTN|nr:hypothetical protein GA0070617_0034 [Micromonospora yangpuensis]